MSDKNKNNLHISEQSQSRFQRNALTDAERIAYLEQMLESEEELNKYVDELTSYGLDRMPAYLEEEILAGIHQETQPQVKTKSKHSVWLPLLGYSVKIGFAAVCAILMLFHMPDISGSADRALQDRIAAWTESRESIWEAYRETVWEKEQTEAENQERFPKRSSYAADALEFITSKIFDGGIEND